MTGDGPSAIDEIARNPVMLAEAQAALPMLQRRASTAAGEAGVRRVIGRQLAYFPARQMGDGEWAIWWRAYIEALADLPEAALEAGMAAYVRQPDAEFMPKAGKLRALAQETPNTAVRAYERAREAIGQAEVQAERKRLPPEQVKALMADFRSRLKTPDQAARQPPPPTPVETDAAGLSPMMRARMG